MAESSTSSLRKPVTQDVLVSYIHSRLLEDGCRVPALDCMNRQVTPRVHPITERIRQHDDWVLSDPCNNQTMRLSAQYIVSRDSTDSSIASGMTEILCHLFTDGRVSFGRLVAVVMFVNQMAQAAMANGQCHRIVKIINWAVCYFDTHGYDAWIECRGGWEVGIQHLRVIPSREVKDVVCDVEKQLDTAARTSQQQTRAGEPIRQRDQGQQQRVQAEQLIRQAVMGTAFLGSLIASVINVLQHQ